MKGNSYKEWQRVNRQIIAKMLAELEYEGVLHAQQQQQNHWLIKLNRLHYRFQATRGIWGWLIVDADSLNSDEDAPQADRALCELGEMLKLSDGQIAENLQDLYATLRADMQLLEARKGMSAEQMIGLDDDRLQCLLSGHPKFIFNKGRRGWGLDALQRYAPEYQGSFRLHWLAVKREAFVWCINQDATFNILQKSMMNSLERLRLRLHLRHLHLDKSWMVIPVHPWQWQQQLALHFLPQLACGELVELGEFGDLFIAQQSLRTLTNVSRRVPFDIKLPLTIYNTSCYRGIPGKYIAAGPLISRWLKRCFQQDETLKRSGAKILEEPAAGYLSHRTYAGLPHAPYRYQEMIGIIWRQNPLARLKQGEQVILIAALMESDNQGRALIAAWIAKSGLTPQAWLTKLFNCVVIPLYHLMCRYGVGLIAHGQNIHLVLKNARPERIFLKDLQGDMRLIDQSFTENAPLPATARGAITHLPAELLIHDLQTGHFVTVLRFISALMAQQCGFSEHRFYQLLAEQLTEYMRQHPDMQERFRLFDLFKPKILRVVLNPVRLGWSEQDSGQRMLPHYRHDLDNPLYTVLREQQQ